MNESRVRFLERELASIGFNDTLRAMDWMINEMNASNGYVRHDGSHYYYHLVDATIDALTLNRGLIEEDTATIIMLHDSQEDIDGVSARMIENMFNSRVAVGVDLLSKKPNIDYKIESNMRAYLHPIMMNRDTAIGKTADRKHNFSTLGEATPEKKLKQALETETYFIPFFKECRNMYPRFAHYFFAAKTAIEPHLRSIKENHATIKSLEEVIYEQERQIANLHYGLSGRGVMTK